MLGIRYSHIEVLRHSRASRVICSSPVPQSLVLDRQLLKFNSNTIEDSIAENDKGENWNKHDGLFKKKAKSSYLELFLVYSYEMVSYPLLLGAIVLIGMKYEL